jgi:hypothetical protein
MEFMAVKAQPRIYGGENAAGPFDLIRFWNSQRTDKGWWHSFELPDGTRIDGVCDLPGLKSRIAQFPIPADLRGKRVLDIGTWDGCSASKWNGAALKWSRSTTGTMDCFARCKPGCVPASTVVRLFLWITAIVSIHHVASGQGTSSSGPIAIEVNGARPLAAALDRVQELVRIPISYEETAYENAADLTRTAPATHPGLRPMIIARGGHFSVTFLASGMNREADAYLAVQAVLAGYADAKFPGSYKAVQKNGAVEVIPSQVLGATGVMRGVTPVMSRPVTFPYAERLALETVQLIVDSASKAAGVSAKMLNVPFDENRRVALGATGQPARDILANLLAKTGGAPKSYQLLYEPNERTYYFNLTPVASTTPDPAGLILD